MLGDGLFELTVNFHLHQGFIVICSVCNFKDAAISLVLEVALPQVARLRHELILHIQVPVLVL